MEIIFPRAEFPRAVPTTAVLERTWPKRHRSVLTCELHTKFHEVHLSTEGGIDYFLLSGNRDREWVKWT